MLDLCSISWTLQTSLEKPVHRSVVKYLETIPELPRFDPMLVTGCFEDLVGCVSVNGNKMVVMERLESFATASAWSLSCTFHHLSVRDGSNFKCPDRPPPTLRCDFPLLGVFHGFPIPFHDDGDPCFGLSRSQLSPRLVG